MTDLMVHLAASWCLFYNMHHMFTLPLCIHSITGILFYFISAGGGLRMEVHDCYPRMESKTCRRWRRTSETSLLSSCCLFLFIICQDLFNNEFLCVWFAESVSKEHFACVCHCVVSLLHTLFLNTVGQPMNHFSRFYGWLTVSFCLCLILQVMSHCNVLSICAHLF